MTSEEQEVAEAVKSLRQAMGLSQQQFSDRLGVTVRTVARYELEKPPSGKTLLRFANVAEGVGRPDLKRIFGKAWITEGASDYFASTDISQAATANLLNWLLLFGAHGFLARFQDFLKSELQKVLKEGKYPISDEDLELFGRLALKVSVEERPPGFNVDRVLDEMTREREQIEESIKTLESLASKHPKKRSRQSPNHLLPNTSKG